jgi:tetratricopeptide (TPR) repeat protein
LKARIGETIEPIVNLASEIDTENAMTRQTIGSIIVGLMTLNPAVPVYAHGGGHGGGGGFHGGAGIHGGAVGGFRGGYAGVGFRGYSAPAFNRTPSFSMPRATPGLSSNVYGNANRFNAATNLNRAGAVNNLNRLAPAANLNRVNTVNNFNRANTFNNANVNRLGVGWNNPYMAYHNGWVHGYWNGHYPGGFGWRPYGYGYPGFYGAGWGGLGLGLGLGAGLGLGWGLSPWLYGPMLYNYGYSNYSNPYYGAGYGGGAVVAQPAVYDYSQPLDAQSAAPAQTATDQAEASFNPAREAFRGGDYARSLELVDQALKATPNDPTLHEFRALTLFALQRYDEAAPALYAVLSVGPGWDWTTMITLYADPETYTQQLRALEANVKQNANSAAARFVLAYHYLTGEHADAAVRQLKLVIAQQPKDTLSAQLIQQLEHPQQQAGAAGVAQPAAPTGTAPPAQTVAEAPPTGSEGKLEGSWTAQPTNDVTITVTFQDGGRFGWKVTRQSQSHEFQGKISYENGILTLVQDQNNSTMVGNVHWTDPTHFSFKVLGAGPDDPGLSFTKSQ